MGHTKGRWGFIALGVGSLVGFSSCDDDDTTGSRVDAAVDTARDSGGATDSAPRASVMGDRRMSFSPMNDVEFIDFFVKHHEEATKMAMMEIDKGQRPEVKRLATMIRDAQQVEIAKMRAARMQLTGTSIVPPLPRDPAMEVHMMAMENASGPAMDLMFLENMIAHHAAGLAPAHMAMPVLQRPDMRMLASEIYEAQSREIGEMKMLLGSIGLPSAMTHGGGPVDGGTDDESLVGDLRVPFTPPDDVGFTTFFITHHKMAIEMADQVIARGASAEVKALASQIRTAQMKEIMEMQAIRVARGVAAEPPPPPADPHMLMDMTAMKALSGVALDRKFLEEMIPHHAAGLPPAKRARPHLMTAEAKKLARDIFDAQSMEIGEMHFLLDVNKGLVNAGSRDAGHD